jgi:ABC-type ATPase involved in cell division
MVSRVVVAMNTSSTTTVAPGSLSGTISCRVKSTLSLFKKPLILLAGKPATILQKTRSGVPEATDPVCVEDGPV